MLFKKIHRYIIIYPPIKLRKIYNYIFYTLYFQLNNIEFVTIPDIIGPFKIINNGVIKFGSGIRFYSTFKSNPIGMTKVCSIYVGENASLLISSNAGFSGVSIYCTQEIRIGENFYCGANVSIWDTDFHPISFESRRKNEDNLAKRKKIVIGDDVFIGANSIILKGVIIGDKCVIGAGSVVTKQIPSNEIWAGNPARFIKRLDN